MTETPSSLPHSRLIVYRKALRLLVVVRDLRVRDCGLREQVLRSAKSICLNIAEATGRTGRADRARIFAIARGEATEVAAALEIAGILEMADVADGLGLAGEIYAMLTALIHR